MSLRGRQPDAILVDLTILENAPEKYLVAAIGDFLTNLSACNDWTLANKHKNEPLNSYAYFLSRQSALDILLMDDDLRKRDVLKKVIHSEVLSGTAMAIAKTSRPCSGSEHLISHAIDYLGLSKGILHGIQVASISLFTLYLQGDLQPKYLHRVKNLGIPLLWTNLIEEFDAKAAIAIYHTALEMRPGRYTRLHEITQDEFISYLEDFNSVVKTM